MRLLFRLLSGFGRQQQQQIVDRQVPRVCLLSSHLRPWKQRKWGEKDKREKGLALSSVAEGHQTKPQTVPLRVISPNRSQSNPDDMITLLRPIQSVGVDLHDVSGTSTGQTLPRERRAPPGTHFCPTIWWVYPPSAIVFILHPVLSTFSSTFVRNIPTFDHSSTLKRRPQTSVTAADLVWVCAPPRTIRKWLRRLAFWILQTRAQDPCNCCCRPGVGLRRPQMVTTPGVLDPADPGARSLQLQLQTWCGSAPRRGPSANGYDAWRFGSESDFCGRNGRWKGLIFRHNRILVQNQGTVLKKSSHRGVHLGHFPSREGPNERRPISCAHSSWIKRSTLLCRKMTWVHPVVSFPPKKTRVSFISRKI